MLFTYFLIKITQNVLFFIDSQFWEMAYFFLISIWDIPITYTNIFLGPNTFKAVEIVGHPHKYTRIQELIVWPCGFLKYTHKSQGGMHLATQDAHLLNFWFHLTVFIQFYSKLEKLNCCFSPSTFQPTNVSKSNNIPVKIRTRIIKRWKIN